MNQTKEMLATGNVPWICCMSSTVSRIRKRITYVLLPGRAAVDSDSTGSEINLRSGGQENDIIVIVLGTVIAQSIWTCSSSMYHAVV